MKAPTLTDVARLAGVSYATADRVVNGRGGVAAKSQKKVELAITELGYVRNVAAANLSQSRVYRFAFVIPTGHNAFFQRVRSYCAEIAPNLQIERVEICVKDVEPFDPKALIDLLAHLGETGFDGVAVVGSEGDGVVAAMRALRAKGVAVLTLVSDVNADARETYVGIDNLVAGSTAARLIGLAHAGQAGRVQPIIGALNARDHRQRLEGLKRTIQAHFPKITVLPEIEGLDQHARVQARLEQALEAHPNTSAIYSLGAGNSGLVRVLQNLPPDQARPTVVLHELSQTTRDALENGLIDVVIDQRPEDEITMAVGLMRRIADRRVVTPPGTIVPAIYVKENLPPIEVADQDRSSPDD